MFQHPILSLQQIGTVRRSPLGIEKIDIQYTHKYIYKILYIHAYIHTYAILYRRYPVSVSILEHKGYSELLTFPKTMTPSYKSWIQCIHLGTEKCCWQINLFPSVFTQTTIPHIVGTIKQAWKHLPVSNLFPSFLVSVCKEVCIYDLENQQDRKGQRRLTEASLGGPTC